MKKQLSFGLTKEEIGKAIDEIVTIYIGLAKKRAKEKENRLMVEEILTLCSKTYGETAVVNVEISNILGDIKILFKYKGERKTPFETDDYSARIIKLLSNSPEHVYDEKRGINIIITHATKNVRKNKMLVNTCIAIALAVITFLLMKILPQNVADTAVSGVFNPLFNKLTAIITEVATPLVFLAVISGIIGLDNFSTVEKVGKKFVQNMFIVYGIAAVLMSIFATVLYGLSENAAVSEDGALKQIVGLVLDMIPDNLLNCFVIDNDLQVIVLAVFVGVVLLSLGKRVEKVINAVNLLSDIVNKMMMICCKALPLIVYLGIVNLLFTDISEIKSIYKVVIVWLISTFGLILFMLIRVKVIVKQPIGKLFKYQLPTLTINLTTSSQVSALPENMKCCKEKFGIDPKVVDFGLPLGIVTYMPSGAIFLGMTVWCAAALSGVPIDVFTMIKIAIVAVVIAIAAPPIPGSAFAVMTILFASCGIPMTYYSVAIILGTVIGYFLPAVNGYLLQLEMLITAKQINMVKFPNEK